MRGQGCKHTVIVSAYRKLEGSTSRINAPYCVVCGEFDPDGVSHSELEEDWSE